MVAWACVEPGRNRPPRRRPADGPDTKRFPPMTRSKTSACARFGRRLAVISAATAATTTVGLAAFAGVGEAHNPSVTAGCKGLKVQLEYYEGDKPNNQVTVTIDGVAEVYTFGDSWSKTFNWNQTQDHTWLIQVEANRITGDPGAWGWDEDDVQHACK